MQSVVSWFLLAFECDARDQEPEKSNHSQQHVLFRHKSVCVPCLPVAPPRGVQATATNPDTLETVGAEPWRVPELTVFSPRFCEYCDEAAVQKVGEPGCGSAALLVQM